jgi:hypothetical protein
MFNTGARVQELLDVRIANVRLEVERCRSSTGMVPWLET